MNAPGWIFILAMVCYLIGAIPFGLLIARAHGVDIRKVGSGNIGATNVGRTLGRKWGILAFLLDVLKGLIPTLWVGRVIFERIDTWSWSVTAGNVAWLACGICCILGHNFPIYLRFKGGKGVATSLGVVLGVYPYLTYAGLLAFAVWIVVTLTSRYVSLGSICAAIALPILLVGLSAARGSDVLKANLPLVGFALLAAGLVLYRHRGNFARLRAGTESRIGGSKDSVDSKA